MEHIGFMPLTRFMVYIACYEFANNIQLSCIGEIFPFHLRAKGIALGVSGICLLNIIWLQAARPRSRTSAGSTTCASSSRAAWLPS